MKKVIFLLFLLVIVLFICSGYLWFQSITKKIFIVSGIGKGNTQVTQSVSQRIDEKSPIDIALLGYGGGNHEGAYLTDSIIVVHIDPKTQKVFLISIPRDIWIKIPTNKLDGSYSKVNAAYEAGLDTTNFPNKLSQFSGDDGGGHMAEYILGEITGITIPYYVGMDFSGFKHTIDTLGGVDITVQTAFTDPQYPIDGNEDLPCGHTDAAIQAFVATDSAETDLPSFFPCRYETLHFNAGLQHMDGEKALSYVRSRHSLEDGTDFGRAARQRNLLVAVKQKIFSAGFIPQIIPFMNSLGNDVTTDLTLDDVRALLQNASVFQNYQIISLALTDQNFLKDTVSSDGQDVLEPRQGIDTWTDVHSWLSDQFAGKTPPVPAIVQVENGTTTSGLATKADLLLKQASLQTLPPITASSQDFQKTQIILYAKNISFSDVNTIKKLFPTATIINQTDSTIPYNIAVIVGLDYIGK